MDFESLSPEIIDLIMDPSEPIPPKHKVFFKNLKAFRADRRSALCRCYQMWKYMSETGSSIPDTAERFGYISRQSVYQVFSGFGVEIPARKRRMRRSKSVALLYSVVLKALTEGKSVESLEEVYEAHKTLIKYTIQDLIYLYHTLSILSVDQIETLKETLDISE